MQSKEINVFSYDYLSLYYIRFPINHQNSFIDNLNRTWKLFYVICFLLRNKHVVVFIFIKLITLTYLSQIICSFLLYKHLYFNHEHCLILLQEAVISCWCNHQQQKMIRDEQSIFQFFFRINNLQSLIQGWQHIF